MHRSINSSNKQVVITINKLSGGYPSWITCPKNPGIDGDCLVFPLCVCFLQTDLDHQRTCLRTEHWRYVTADSNKQHGFYGLLSSLLLLFNVDFSLVIRFTIPSCVFVLAGLGCFIQKLKFGSWGWKDPRISHAVNYQCLVMMDLLIGHSKVRR